MDEYRIVHQVNPPLWAIPRFCRPGFLFNEHEQLLQQNNGRFYLLSALNLSSQQTEARCAFFLRANKASSPAAAPFGPIEFTETLPDQVLDNIITSLLQAVRLMGATQFQLTNYPTCYAPRQTERLVAKLLTYGFVVIESHSTHFLPIKDLPFTDTLAPSEQRRLRKCERAGFRVAYESQPDLTQVMTFLKTIRQQKGYPFTIVPPKLMELLSSFPDYYSVFTVRDADKLIALSLTVRVRHDILYHFLPASHPDYQTFSPMVMLTEGLYRYCQQQQIALLDLGLSIDHHRQPKPSLMRFKRNLGAQESPKLVFQKQF